MKVIAWNLAQRDVAWRLLVDSDADVALVQEARQPPADVAHMLGLDPAPWQTGLSRPWRVAVVKLSDRVGVEWLEPKGLDEAHQPGELAVSRAGTLAAATVTPTVGESVTVVSMYACWERFQRPAGGGWLYADASAHRLISDLSALIGRESGHRILAAGDLNILHGHGDHGSAYWASRYATVFSRMSALGLSFVGPQAPSGRQAEPWPAELPQNSLNVPTYHTRRKSPETATRQLDFVFASAGLSEHVRVRALNAPDEWGPSDHCRVEIEIA